MTVAAHPITPPDGAHLVLHHVSWGFYERLLEEIGDRPIRVTFDEGSIEIMPPLAEHERPSRAIGTMIQLLAVERNIPMVCYGSTTFRREDSQKGVEPADCFYVANESRARGMKDFDPHAYPPPDLVIEVDVTHRSIPRQPIYAALGVPELWRYDGRELHVLHLGPGGAYERQARSAAFPFLPMAEFEKFVKRMEVEQQTSVLRDFRDWVRSVGT